MGENAVVATLLFEERNAVRTPYDLQLKVVDNRCGNTSKIRIEAFETEMDEAPIERSRVTGGVAVVVDEVPRIAILNTEYHIPKASVLPKDHPRIFPQTNVMKVNSADKKILVAPSGHNQQSPWVLENDHTNTNGARINGMDIGSSGGNALLVEVNPENILITRKTQLLPDGVFFDGNFTFQENE